MGKVRFIGGEIGNGDIGISMPSDSSDEIELYGTKVHTNRIGIEVRDPIAEVGLELGLRHDIPTDELVRILQDFAKAAPRSPEAAVTAVQATGMERWLAAGTNLLTVANILLDWASKGMLTELLIKLHGG